MRMCAACRGGLEASLGTLTKLNMQLSVNVRDSSEFYEIYLDLTFLSHQFRPVNNHFVFSETFFSRQPCFLCMPAQECVCAFTRVCVCVPLHTQAKQPHALMHIVMRPWPAYFCPPALPTGEDCTEAFASTTPISFHPRGAQRKL